MTEPTAELLARSRAYIESFATRRADLAAASGVTEAELAAIDEAGALPAPTYVVSEGGVFSPIRSLGVIGDEQSRESADAFYCPAVLNWVRRARFLGFDAPSLRRRLEAWFAGDFTEALQRQSRDAREFGWAHLFDSNGEIPTDRLEAEIRTLCTDWMEGGWAVCLRRWNGHHVVTKDLERARIATLTEDCTRDLDDAGRRAVFDAIERLDSVMLPFAPYERPYGTPGLFIDRVRARYGL